MRKVVLACACVAFLSGSLLAATLADVTLPDSITIGNQTLVLNGMGLRSKMFIKVYVAGLYLEKKTSDPAAIVQSDGPKRVVMQFIYSEVSKEQMAEAFDEGFKNNAAGTPKAQAQQWIAGLESMKKGEQMVVTYLPGTGTTLTIRGKDKVTVPGLPFAQSVFSVWFGPKPPSSDLKTGMLGKK